MTAAIYIRVSTLAQVNEGYSLEAQKLALESCVDKKSSIPSPAAQGIENRVMGARYAR